MPEEFREFPLDELLAGLIELTLEGNAGALEALTRLVIEQAAEIPAADLERLAALDHPGAAVLRHAAAREMRRRGVWRRFRLRQLARLYGSAVAWLAGIVVIALLFLVVVLGGVVGLKWLLNTLGF